MHEEGVGGSVMQEVWPMSNLWNRDLAPVWLTHDCHLNPHHLRTVPFVAKAVGHPIAKYASLAMAGKTLKEIGLTEEPLPTNHVAVKVGDEADARAKT